MLAGWQSELIFQASWEWWWILLGKGTGHHVWAQEIISQRLWLGSHHVCVGCVHLTSLQQSESWKSNGGKWKLQMGFFFFFFFAGVSLWIKEQGIIQSYEGLYMFPVSLCICLHACGYVNSGKQEQFYSVRSDVQFISTNWFKKDSNEIFITHSGLGTPCRTFYGVRFSVICLF